LTWWKGYPGGEGGRAWIKVDRADRLQGAEAQKISAIESEPIWKLEKLSKKMDLDDVNWKRNGETALHILLVGETLMKLWTY